VWCGKGYVAKLCFEYELLVVFSGFRIANIRWMMGFSLYYTEKKDVDYVKKLRFRGEGSTE
jgi:hypothetical protein